MSDTEFLQFEESFWFGDADFYRDNLAEDCRMALPGMGLVDRTAAIAGIESGPRWSEVEMHEQRVERLGHEVALVSYRAKARGASGDYEALIGSVYSRTNRGWKLAFHQHSLTAS